MVSLKWVSPFLLLILVLTGVVGCNSGGGGGEAPAVISQPTQAPPPDESAPPETIDTTLDEDPIAEADVPEEETVETLAVLKAVEEAPPLFIPNPDFTNFEEVTLNDDTRKVIYDTNLPLTMGHQLTVELETENQSIDPVFTIGLRGFDKDQRLHQFLFRVRKKYVELYTRGKLSGHRRKLIDYSSAGNIHKIIFTLLSEGIVFNSFDGEDNQIGHGVYLFKDFFNPETANFDVITTIARGEGIIKNISYFKTSDSGPLALLDYLDQVEKGVDFLFTDEIDLSDRFQELKESNPRYIRYRDDMTQENQFKAAETTWLSYGARKLFNRTDKKLIRYQFSSSDASATYGDIRLYDKFEDVGYRYSLVFNKGVLSFFTYANKVKQSQKLLDFQSGELYTLDFWVDENTLAIAVQKGEEGGIPKHIFSLPGANLKTSLALLRGKLTEMRREVSVVETFPGGADSPTQFLEDNLQNQSVLKTSREEVTRWVTYKDTEDMNTILNARYARWFPERIPPELEIKSDGSKYQHFSHEKVFARDLVDGAAPKGLHFQINFDDVNLDPIFFIGIEGRGADNKIKRQGITIRHNRIYLEYFTANPHGKKTLRPEHISIPLDWNTPFSLEGILEVKIEPYQDGTALYVNKLGDPPSSTPLYIIKEAPMNLYQWKSYIYRNKAFVQYMGEYDLPAANLSALSVALGDVPYWVAEKKLVFGSEQFLTFINGEQPFNEAENEFSLFGDGKTLRTFYIHPEKMDISKRYDISFKVKIGPTATKPQLLAEIYGSAPKGQDAFGKRYRNHYLEFWQNEVYAHHYGAGEAGRKSSVIFENYKRDTYYQVDIVLDKGGSFFRVYEDGADPTSFRSAHFLRDSVGTFRLRHRTGIAVIKDFLVSSSDLTDLEIPSDFFMGSAFKSEWSPVAISDQTPGGSAFAHTDIQFTPIPCWINQAVDFVGQSDGGLLMLKSDKDPRSLWDGMACSQPIDRNLNLQLDVTVNFPAPTANRPTYIMGYKGLNKKPRQHSLRFVYESGNLAIKLIGQKYMPAKGWIKTTADQFLAPDTDYIISFRPFINGNRITISDSEGAVIFTDEMLASEFPGELGEVDSQASDWPPYFFIMQNRDHIIIKNFELSLFEE